MPIGPETFVNLVQIWIILKKRHKRPLQMLEKLNPKQKHLSAMPLIKSSLWETVLV